LRKRSTRDKDKPVELMEIKRIKRWMNNYPRKLLGYRTAKQIAKEHLQNTCNLGVDIVAL